MKQILIALILSPSMVFAEGEIFNENQIKNSSITTDSISVSSLTRVNTITFNDGTTLVSSHVVAVESLSGGGVTYPDFIQHTTTAGQLTADMLTWISTGAQELDDFQADFSTYSPPGGNPPSFSNTATGYLNMGGNSIINVSSLSVNSDGITFSTYPHPQCGPAWHVIGSSHIVGNVAAITVNFSSHTMHRITFVTTGTTGSRDILMHFNTVPSTTAYSFDRLINATITSSASAVGVLFFNASSTNPRYITVNLHANYFNSEKFGSWEGSSHARTPVTALPIRTQGAFTVRPANVESDLVINSVTFKVYGGAGNFGGGSYVIVEGMTVNQENNP